MPLREILSLSPKIRQEEEGREGKDKRRIRERQQRAGGRGRRRPGSTSADTSVYLNNTTVNALKLVSEVVCVAAVSATESALLAGHRRLTINHCHFVVLPNY